MTRRIAIFLLLAASAFAQGKIETIASTPKVPDTIANVLQSQGLRVTLPDGAIAAELWWRKDVSAGKDSASDAAYPALPRFGLIGVVAFPAGSKDYRGQPIAAGAYTLRYAVLPKDGNHMGAAPLPDMLLLVPVAADPGPDAVVTYEKLLDLSRKASATNHPAVYALVNTKSESFPSLREDFEGHIILESKLTVGGKEIPVALIVKGESAQ